MLVGIDLGTTNSLIAVYRNGAPELIPNRLGKFLTPSVIGIDEDGSLMVGEAAKEYGILHPLNTAKVFKRSMGTEKSFTVGNRQFVPEELSSLVLKSLKEDAEVYLAEKVSDAIISVPAYFNEFQRKATKRAGELAGLNVVRIINEPTAAAIAYGVGEEDKDERCLVFDLGGGTFDISILEFYKNIMEVHAIAGDNHVGGEDFTQILANMFLERAVIAPESLDVRVMNAVLKAAERTKCLFCETASPTMSVTIDGNLVEQEIDLADYEKACEPILEKMRKPIERSLRDADVHLDEIDRVLLVGGATRLPIVKNFVAMIFRRFPDASVDPDTAVACGAAIQCAMKERNKDIEEIVLTDVCPFTLGTEVNMFNGFFDEPGHYLPIIERNTTIPVSRSQTVCTSRDNQTRLDIKILQGESRLAGNNIELGMISIPVPAASKGKEAAEITYTYDINSLLEVEVKVLSTGETRKTIVKDSSHCLSDEDIAERFEKLAYLKLKPRDEEANRLLLSRGERLYEEVGMDEKESINRLIMEFERVLEKQDRQQIERKRKEITKAFDNIEFM